MVNWRQVLTGDFVSPKQYQQDSNNINAGNRAGEKKLDGILEKVRNGEDVSSEDRTWAERHGGNSLSDAEKESPSR